MNKVLLILVLTIISILLSMLVVFIVALSTGYSFSQSLLCGVTYYRMCNKDSYQTYKNNDNRYDNDYDAIGGISGIGWVL